MRTAHSGQQEQASSDMRLLQFLRTVASSHQSLFGPPNDRSLPAESPFICIRVSHTRSLAVEKKSDLSTPGEQKSRHGGAPLQPTAARAWQSSTRTPCLFFFAIIGPSSLFVNQVA
jgi:hypothetical protein